MDQTERIPGGVVRVRAPNPSAFTLDGTNTYVVERWVIDPGPNDTRHLDAVIAAAGDGIEGIAITHAHPDHDEGAPALAERAGGVPVVRPEDGQEVRPLIAMATPGHAPAEMALRDRDELLDAAWDDVPWHVSPDLRRAVGVTLDVYLEKLRDEGRLPSDVKA